MATKPERSTTQPTMQQQAQLPICLLARPQPEPSQPSSQQAQLTTPANPPPTLLELAARLPVVINLTRDTHRVSYDYATEMCAEVIRLGRLFKSAALVTKPTTSEATPTPPAKEPTKPPTTENPNQPSTFVPFASTKKDQPSADITAQLKKVKADISI